MAYSIPYEALYEGQQAEEYKARKAKEKEEKDFDDMIKKGSRSMAKGGKMLKDKNYAHTYIDAQYDAGKEISKRRKADKDRYPSTKELVKDPYSDKAKKMANDIANAADAIERQNRRHPGNYNPKQGITDKLHKKVSHHMMDKQLDKLNKSINESAGIFESVQFI